MVNLRCRTYGVENPGGAVPGWGVERRPQIEEEHGGNATTAHVLCGILRRLNDLDVCADDPHADGAANGANHQKVASTDAIDQVQEPYESDGRFDDTEQTRTEQVGVFAVDTNGFENLQSFSQVCRGYQSDVVTHRR